LRLAVDKDRNGAVRGISASGKNPGTVRVSSIMDSVGISIEAPMGVTQEEAGDKKWRPTGLMTKVSAFLEEFGPRSGHQILEHVRGNAGQRRIAIDRLVTEGFVARSAGLRNAIIYTSVRPFIEHPDAELDQLDQPGPELDQKSAQRVGPPTPLPYGGGPAQRSNSDGEKASSWTNTDEPVDQALNCKHCDTVIDEQTWDANDGYCRDDAWMGKT
jgi:hypothetical protein